MAEVNRRVSELLAAVGLAADAARLDLEDEEFVCDSPHRLELAATTAIAAEALAAAAFWRLRGGRFQVARVDRRISIHALATGLLLSINRHPVPIANGARAAISDFYQTADGCWIHPMGTYPGLRDGMLALLDCANTREGIARAIARWDGQALEDAIAVQGLAGAMVRPAETWRAHPQGRQLAETPIIEIVRTGDAPPRPLAFHDRPLGAVRVLDLSHVIAGPVLARTLAGHGAEVLRLNSPRWPDPMEFVLDTGWGKRSAYLDLDDGANHATLERLLASSDVFIESWRPGSLARFGLSHSRLAERHPGLVSVCVSAFGKAGPWSGRKGFEQLAQAVSGIASDEARDGRPRYVPTGLLADYLAGYLGAVGAVSALARQRREGGSYHVHVSLTRLAMWVQDLGRVDPVQRTLPAVALAERSTPYGRLRHLPPLVQLSETPARWDLPPCPPGAHEPEWNL